VDSADHTGLRKPGKDFSGLSVYPNPAGGQLNISFTPENPGELTVRIMSLGGQEVYRSEQSMSGGPFTLHADIRSLAAGVYAIILQSGSSIQNLKLVKY
jgi:hypothetical protein